MFPEQITLELGKYVNDFIYWLNNNYGMVFDVICNGVRWLLLNIEWMLLLMPWWFLIALVFILGWRLKSLLSGVVFAVMLFIIGAFGLWEPTMSTLAIVLTAVFFAADRDSPGHLHE